MSYYFVDSNGGTIGPVSFDDLKSKYQSKRISSNTYIWNGTDINDWTKLGDLSSLLKKLNPAPRLPPKPRMPTVPRKGASKVGASPDIPKSVNKPMPKGRRNLLASIRQGTNLKKTKKVVNQNKSNNSIKKNKPRGPLSMQEEMALRLKKRKGGSKPKPKTKPVRKSKPLPALKKPSVPSTARKPRTVKKRPSLAAQRPSFVGKSPSISKSKSPSFGSRNTSINSRNKSVMKNNSVSSSGSRTSERIDKIVKKIKNAEEWQMKASEAILDI